MRLQVRDVELQVDRQGAVDADGTNAVVLGVHGGPGLDSALIRYVLRGAARFTTVVTYDQRGHGRSEPSTPDRWNLDTWADDLAALVGVLQLDRPVLVGTSFGGFVVLHALARHPDLARGALIVGSAARELPRDELVRRYRELGGHSEDPPELAALRAERIITPEVARHFHVDLPAMDLRREIAHVKCPVTVVVGDHDPFVPAWLAAETVAALPSGLGRLIVLPDAAHDAFIDAPGAFHLLVADLARLPSQPQ